MADSDPESEITFDTLSLRHLSSSIFSIPGYLVGFGTKGLSDFDSIRSPTSPLEIGVFSNFRKPVTTLQFARSSSEKGHKKELSHNGVVGLGIVNSLADEKTSQVLGKNIIFGPQVRPNGADAFSKSYKNVSLDSSLRSKSLPTNYVASRLSQTKRLREAEPENSPLCFSDSNVPSSLASSSYKNLGLGSENFCSEAKPVTSVELENLSDVKPSTGSIPIGPSQGYVGSLSARDIELSEDYTCIISHGPNPKTIHIFGDCVLERHAIESNNFGNEGGESGENSERSNPVQPNEVLTFCFACERKFEEGEEVYMYRGDKAFCSFDCSEEETEAETETEIAYQKSSGSSFQEDLFLLGMPVAM